MNFEQLLNQNHQVILSFKNRSVDYNSLKSELDSLSKELKKAAISDNGNYLINVKEYQPKARVTERDEFIIVEESEVFKVYREIMSYYRSGDIALAKNLYDKLETIYRRGDKEAYYAIAMCKYNGVFYPKKKDSRIWDEMLDHAKVDKIGIAYTLLAQHFYQTYEKFGDPRAKNNAIIFLKAGINHGSVSAKEFNRIYHLI